MKIDFSIDFEKFKLTKDILKERKAVDFENIWMNIAQLFPKSILFISDFIMLVSYKEFYDEMLDYTPKIKWPIEDKELFGINLYIIALLLQTGKPHIHRRDIMLNAQTLINPDIISTDTVNEKFFPSLLLVLERMMILLEEPEHEMAPELPFTIQKKGI